MASGLLPAETPAIELTPLATEDDSARTCPLRHS
jgi:hypothetical protein